MDTSRGIKSAKLIVILGFLVLLSSTYYLRREVLALSHIRFSADEALAKHEIEERKKSFPDRVKKYKAEQKNYQLKQSHYQKMLKLYQEDPGEYMKRMKNRYEPPQVPYEPQPPTPPELSKKLFEINTQFRARKNQYFGSSQVLNGISWLAALMLAGGLVYLLMFDTAHGRWIYGAALMLSFVFMIGPSFHSFLSAIIGFLEPPSVF